MPFTQVRKAAGIVTPLLPIGAHWKAEFNFDKCGNQVIYPVEIDFSELNVDVNNIVYDGVNDISDEKQVDDYDGNVHEYLMLTIDEVKRCGLPNLQIDPDAGYHRCPGPMFSLDNVQKVLREAHLLHLFQ